MSVREVRGSHIGTLSGAARELIEGVYKLKEQLLLILNTEKAASVGVAA